MNVYISYTLEDKHMFKFSNLLISLRNDPQINAIFFYSPQLSVNMNDFMDDNIPKSNIILMFFGPESPTSASQQHELSVAVRHQKIIIPIYQDYADVSNEVKKLIGVLYDATFPQNSISTIIKKIHDNQKYFKNELDKNGSALNKDENALDENALDEDIEDYNPNWHHYCGFCKREDGPMDKDYDKFLHLLGGRWYRFHYLSKKPDACAICGSPLLFNDKYKYHHPK